MQRSACSCRSCTASPSSTCAATPTPMPTGWRIWLWIARPEPDRAGETSGRRAVPAIRAEDVRMACGTESGHEDPLGCDAGRFELLARTPPRIEIPPPRLPARQSRQRPVHVVAGRGVAEPAFDLLAWKAGGHEPVANVDAHLVATPADRRTYRRKELASHHPKPLLQDRNGSVRDARGETAPACMRGRHAGAATIDQQQRHAVGRLNGYCELVAAAHDDVSIRQSVVAALRHDSVVAVDLACADESRSVHTQRGGDLRPGVRRLCGRR